MTTVKKVIRDAKTNSVEATWVDAQDIPVKCRSYADVQMAELEADLGPDVATYASLIATVRAAIVPYVPPALTPDDIVQAMDDLFNAVAHAKHYDNRVTCALRAGYPGPFHAEGLAFATWMDNCNAAAYAMLQEVQGGTRQMPQTITEALALLPAAPW